MNGGWQCAEQRILGLLADEAAFGLDSSEIRELEELMDLAPDFDSQCIDRVAGIVVLARCFAPDETMPVELQRRIRDDALKLTRTQRRKRRESR